MSSQFDHEAMLNAFIAEFPEAHIVRTSMRGGEFDEAWLWIFDMSDKVRPAISDELRERILAFFVESDEDYYDWYIAEVREHLDKLPRRAGSAA